MKKLKIQKALLAISLALPITLSINNATNAMNSNQKGTYKTLNQQNQNSVLYQLFIYAISKGRPTQLNEQQTTAFLQSHIQDVIEKYLSLIIQSNFNLLPPIKAGDGQQYLNRETVYNLLFGDQQQLDKNQRIMSDDGKTQQITQLLNIIKNTPDKKDKQKTTEDLIVASLFFPLQENETPQSRLQQLNEQLQQYQQKGGAIRDPEYTSLMKYLGPVAKQLQIDSEAQQNYENGKQLHLLSQAVETFSTTYGNRQINKNAEKEIQKQFPVSEDDIKEDASQSQLNKNGINYKLPEQFENKQPEAANQSKQIFQNLIDGYTDQLFHKAAVNFFKTANKGEDIENIDPERLLQQLQTQNPDYLEQLVYAHFLKFDINIYKQAEQQEKFNAYLDIIIQSDQLVIDEQNPSTIDHPLASDHNLASNSSSSLDQPIKKAKEILYNLLKEIADKIDQDPNNLVGNATKLIQQGEQLREQDADTKAAIITIGDDIINILNAACANITSSQLEQKLPSQNLKKVQLKIATLTTIITNLKEQQQQTIPDNNGIISTSDEKKSSETESNQIISPLEADLKYLENEIDKLKQQYNADQNEKETIALLLTTQKTLSYLNTERIDKLTTSINMLEQRQQHQETVTKYSLQVKQQLLDLFEQLNKIGALGPISDGLKTPIEAIATETKKFKEIREQQKRTETTNDLQLKQLQNLYAELIKELKATKNPSNKSEQTNLAQLSQNVKDTAMKEEVSE